VERRRRRRTGKPLLSEVKNDLQLIISAPPLFEAFSLCVDLGAGLKVDSAGGYALPVKYVALSS
jgi:hypothetical protein